MNKSYLRSKNIYTAFRLISLCLPILFLLSIATELKAGTNDPSGTYIISSSAIATRTITLTCTQTACKIEGFGPSISASRTVNLVQITQGWADQGDAIAVAEVSLTGREYRANDPQYPELKSYWIAQTMNSVATDISDFFGSRISDPIGETTTQIGFLIISLLEQGNTKFISLFLASQGMPAMQKNCLSNRNGCWFFGVGGGVATTVGISTTLTSTTTTTALASITTTTEVASTTSSLAGTTTIEISPTTELTTTTIDEEITESIPTESNNADSNSTQSGGDSIDAAFDSPSLSKPSTAPNSLTTTAVALATLSGIGVMGGVASRLPGTGGTSPLGGGSANQQNTGPAFSEKNSENLQRKTISDSALSNDHGGGIEQSLFTTEQLERSANTYIENHGANNILFIGNNDEPWKIWAPTFIQNSRILCRAYVDILLFSSLIQPSKVTPKLLQPGRKPALLFTLIIPIIAAYFATQTFEVNNMTWTTFTAIVALLFGLVSAVHGFIFAATFLLIGITTPGFYADGSPLLKIAIMLVLTVFVPLLSNSFCQPRSLESFSRRDKLNLVSGFITIGLFALKTTQELGQQIGGITSDGNFQSTYITPNVLLPSILGGVFPGIRTFIEYRVRKMGQAPGKFLNASAGLRSGELPAELSLSKRLAGNILCAIFIALTVHTYTSNFVVVGFVTCCFMGVVIANLDKAKAAIYKVPLPFNNILPVIPTWFKISTPTVIAILLGLFLGIFAPNSSRAALLLTCGFAISNLLFEIYDIRSEAPSQKNTTMTSTNET